MEVTTGGGAEFTALSHRVRPEPLIDWTFSKPVPETRVEKRDWIYGVLKELSYHHSRQHGWSLQEQTNHVPPLEESLDCETSLLFRHGSSAIWVPPARANAKAAIDKSLEPSTDEFIEAADNFIGNASVSFAVFAIEWQMAERSAELAGNPFFPLVECLRAGFYPFSISPTLMMLFAFRDRRKAD